MVQTTLGMTPSENVTYEYIDAVPQQQKIKKKIQKEGEWVDRIFIRIPLSVSEMRPGMPGELENWCRKHYKEPMYLGPWFKVSGYIVLDEQVYVHWMLFQ